MPHTVKPGDCYHRVEQPTKFYRVVSIREPDHHPPHAVLATVGSERDRITISLFTLTDGRHWRISEAAK
jgi:hypothetical protein